MTDSERPQAASESTSKADRDARGRVCSESERVRPLAWPRALQTAHAVTQESCIMVARQALPSSASDCELGRRSRAASASASGTSGSVALPVLARPASRENAPWSPCRLECGTLRLSGHPSAFMLQTVQSHSIFLLLRSYRRSISTA